MEGILIAIISVLGTIIAAFLASRYSKNSALDDEEDKLIRTLQGLGTAQEEKIKQLQTTINEQALQIQSLTDQIQELREVIVSQALLIEGLTRKDNAP